MTSLMQYFGKSLNKISTLRLHEKANRTCRRALGFVVDILADSPSDETEKYESVLQMKEMNSLGPFE